MRLTFKQAGGRLAVATLVAALASTLAVGADPPAADAQSAAGAAPATTPAPSTPAAKKTVPAKWPAAKKGAESPGKFTLVSPDIGKDNPIALDQVFNGFGCKGKNLSPALFWSGAPAGTQSFAIMVHDPDAPTGSGFWHWVVYNIPASAVSIPAEAGDVKKKGMPVGVVQGRNDFGAFGYGGPCPPPGKPHHYHFRVFALKVPKLDVPNDATAALIGFNVNANKIAEADLVGMYGR
jgi:Raf kinase inhibitor-like YbhB/YbcL family protein